jgi:hypothetical protein
LFSGICPVNPNDFDTFSYFEITGLKISVLKISQKPKKRENRYGSPLRKEVGFNCHGV